MPYGKPHTKEQEKVIKNERRQKKRQAYDKMKEPLIGLGGKAIKPTAENKALRAEEDKKIMDKRKVDAILENERIAKLAKEQQLAEVSPEQKATAEQVGVLTPEQEQLEIIKGEGAVDTAAEIGGAIAGGVTGAGVGAAVGAFPPLAAATLGVSIPAGALIFGTIGAIGGALAKMSLDQRQDVKQSFATGVKANSNLNYYINAANAGMNSQQALEGFNTEKSYLYAAESTLKEMTKGKIGRELSAGMDERAKIEALIRLIPDKEILLRNAILQPNPLLQIDTRDIDSEIAGL